jgi:exo-beta-1,3-glucanase (GH17 family)
MAASRSLTAPVLLLGALVTILVWWFPNRQQAGDVPMVAERFNSVSFAPFREGQSPLRDIFPTAAQVEEDIALIAPRVRAIRSYASLEGNYETAEIAGRHGVKMWKGAWLGRDLRQNDREIAALIATANRHPEVVERVVVGNEVLLRRDLPVEELARQIDRVKAAVRQPVTYADVWEFWAQFPELAKHVDIVTIHILPYWEDEPLGVDVAMAHVRDVYRRIKAMFPDKPIAIGEIGWPSAGRWREAATPSRVEQAVFLRRFIQLSQEEGFDYNLIEAFDQVWKYRNEGTVGAAWGLWTADREPKFDLSGPVRENPWWAWYAGAALLLGGAMFAAAARTWPAAAGWKLALLSAALGNALAYAFCGGWPYAFDEHLKLAFGVNLLGQALLAALLLRRAGARLSGSPIEPARNGAQASANIRSIFRGRFRFRDWRAFAFEDLLFLFLFTAAVLQMMLLFDPRYRDFPFPTFAVPLVAVIARALLRDLPRRGGGWAEWLVGGVLVVCAAASAILEGPHNLQALGWTVCAFGLALPPLLRVGPLRREVAPGARSPQGSAARAG